jgi:nucleotide-binding universal stress UspA family protein
MSLPKRILVATDFSETSDRALDYAIDLASRIGASVIVMHAYELPIVGFPDGAFLASADVASRISTAAQNGLDATVAARFTRGVDLKKVLKQDAPWDAVNAVAKEVGAELVVCGTHGRKGLAHALLGSVAEKVVRTCDVPVLTIRGPREESAR